ncbi:MAG: sulfotransferase [Aurantimonas endophytica]|uniref:sulfotransferase n=1 Tax=Aurantimonas endophytica TaxID=1522175 RepID=UPI003002AD15
MLSNLFLSVGAMKAGTTWLEKVLSTHPDVFFTFEKEIHYFAHAYIEGEGALSKENRLRRASQYSHIEPSKDSLEDVRNRLMWAANYLSDPINDLWYRNLFLFRDTEAYCADFSNLYAHIEKPGWDRISAGVKRLRVIYTMRDPISRLWSHAKFHSQFVGKADDVNHWTPEIATRFMRRPFMWKHAEYGQTVRRLSGSLREDQLRITFFENLHEDQRGWLRSTEDFLEVAHHGYSDELLSRRVNESSSAPMPEWFPELFREDVQRICSELSDQGYEPPASWLRYYQSGTSAT